jgi:carboxyvinyl-carboxyphosphonate phosphorylmutase
VQELEAAGVAAISLEDTLIPPAFGGPAPQLIALDEMVGRLNAAVAAREDESLVLIARTHAGEVGTGPDRDADIAMRLRAYAGAGADMLCLTGVQSLAQFETLAQVAQGLNKPLLLISYAGTAVARGLSDLALLARHGVRLLVDGHAPYFAGLQATYAALKALREGINAAHLPGLPAPELVARLSRRAEHEAWASEFLDKA